MASGGRPHNGHAGLPYTVAVDEALTFDEFKQLLNRHAELPMDGTRNAERYAEVSLALEEKARKARQEHAYDEAYMLYRRCLHMIEHKVWDHRDAIDANRHCPISRQQIKAALKAAMDGQEDVLNNGLPRLHQQHLDELQRTKAHRERLLAEQRRTQELERDHDNEGGGDAPVTGKTGATGGDSIAAMRRQLEAEEHERHRKELSERQAQPLFAGLGANGLGGGAATTPAPPAGPPPGDSWSFPAAAGGTQPPKPPASAAPSNVAVMPDAERHAFVDGRDKNGASALLSGLAAASQVTQNQQRPPQASPLPTQPRPTQPSPPHNSAGQQQAPLFAGLQPQHQQPGGSTNQPQRQHKEVPQPQPARPSPPAAPAPAPTPAAAKGGSLLQVPQWSQEAIRRRTQLYRLPSNPASPSRPRGLVNLGNTCYINSTLQCLAATALGNYFMTDDYIQSIADRYTGGGKIANVFTFVMRELRVPVAEHPRAVSASNVKRMIAQQNPMFDNYSQQDASEFYQSLIAGLHEDLNARKGAKGTGGSIETHGRPERAVAEEFLAADAALNESPVHKLLRFQERSVTVCGHCGDASPMFPVATGLQLDIPGNVARTVSVEDCLAAYMRESTVEGRECERCKRKATAKNQHSLWSTPSMLVVTLKRFIIFSADAEKNTTPVAFQPELDLAPFLAGPADAQRSTQYRLVGVVNHQGALGGGHYTADVRGRDGSWWYCSDEDVRPSAQPSFQKAYMLFYQRMAPASSSSL